MQGMFFLVVQPYGQGMKEIYNQCMEFNFCLLSKLCICVDRTDLFKIILLVYGAG